MFYYIFVGKDKDYSLNKQAFESDFFIQCKEIPPFVTEILSQMGADTVVNADIDIILLALQTYILLFFANLHSTFLLRNLGFTLS